VEPEIGTELLQSCHKTLIEELLLMDEPRRWFLEMKSTLVEYTVKIVGEMTTKDLEYI